MRDDDQLEDASFAIRETLILQFDCYRYGPSMKVDLRLPQSLMPTHSVRSDQLPGAAQRESDSSARGDQSYTGFPDVKDVVGWPTECFPKIALLLQLRLL